MTKTLSQWLEYMTTLHTQSIDLGLERVKTVFDALNLPVFKCKVITVAGTNGKGSTIATLNAIYHQHGYRVGQYTSPHLISFNERISVNKIPASDQTLSAAFSIINEARKDKKITLTFFEMTTLAAFYIFSQEKLDVLLLEVGMGGRLDAVNIIEPDLCIITNISRDHMAWLGENEEAIGAEKAGILRQNVPLVYADITCPESVKEHAKQLNCPLYQLSQHFDYQLDRNHFNFKINDKTIFNNLPKPNLHLENVTAALMTTQLLNKTLPTTSAGIQKALSSLHLPGRFQRIEGAPSILLDVAHNQAATQRLAQFLKQSRKDIPGRGEVHAVLAMMEDKEILESLKPLTESIDTWHVASFDNPRAASSLQLKENLKDLKVKQCYTHPSIDQAFKNAVARAKQNDTLVVFGSFYTVGEVLKTLNEL